MNNKIHWFWKGHYESHGGNNNNNKKKQQQKKTKKNSRVEKNYSPGIGKAKLLMARLN